MTQPTPTIQLACELIERASVTPDDAGCQQLMGDRLASAGFNVQALRYGEVDNFWAVHGDGGPLLVFAGHTDVVPAGNTDDWEYPPFTAKIVNGELRGRGAADMKGSLAAMLVAAETFVAANPDHPGRLAFLITSDEEGVAVNGTVKVVEHLQKQGEKIDWCVVGEPSSTEAVGDVVKIGRRGSLGFKLLVKGIQGHVAYPQLARNPILQAAPALAELAEIVWDNGNQHFPPTSFQVSNITAGTGTTNVIPASLEVTGNFRYCTESSAETLQQRLLQLLDRHGLDYEIRWQHSGKPFLTKPGKLIAAVQQAINAVSGQDCALSTAGGTSDGRFIAPTGAEVVELGPANATIHQVDERSSVAGLNQLTQMYQKILENLLR
ncbi:MAG: succinyl-diaminopimelate desuccinylase [Gammaproteobacteria bacterium]|nr:succinyl-diaminopimelate desuccinylase [Gammaproteobacteria bacterium]